VLKKLLKDPKMDVRVSAAQAILRIERRTQNVPDAGENP